VLYTLIIHLEVLIMNKWVLGLLASGFLLAQAVHGADCVNEQWPIEKLRTLKSGKYIGPESVDKNALIAELLLCLKSSDSELRDGIAFEGFSTLMRQKLLSVEQLRNLRGPLQEQLVNVDESGVARPFAALVMSELARTDRVDAWMSEEERAQMLLMATQYLRGIRDYRGFEASTGWRHGVAHGADWLMQLALNPALNAEQLRAITDAVATQIKAKDGHSYVFGEPGRLARPIIYAAKRGIRTEAEWTEWLLALQTELKDPVLAYRNAHWLATRHNLNAFLSTLYVETDLSPDEALNPLHLAVVAALKSMP
jgi:hypothetical protein